MHKTNCTSCLTSGHDCMYHTIKMTDFDLKYICWPTSIDLSKVIRHDVVRSDNESCPDVPSFSTTQKPTKINLSTTWKPMEVHSAHSNLHGIILGFLIGIALRK